MSQKFVIYIRFVRWEKLPQRSADLGVPPGPRGDAERSRTSSDPLPLWGKILTLWGKIQSIFEIHLHSECFLSQGISRKNKQQIFSISVMNKERATKNALDNSNWILILFSKSKPEEAVVEIADAQGFYFSSWTAPLVFS